MAAGAGAEAERAGKRGRGGAGGGGGDAAASRTAAPDEPFQVPLEHGRWRHFGWVLTGVLGGGFLIWKLGVVGQVVGVILVLVGLYNAVRFARTLMRPAGAIDVGEEQVSLPAALCSTEVVSFPYDKIRHVFFLRRAVPWTRTGPILVVQGEAQGGDRLLSYPRDWFGSDSDQRRIALAINRRLGRL
jgi:hypothetical protein